MSTLKANTITDAAGTGGPAIKGAIDGGAATAGDRGEWAMTQMSTNVTINNALATLLSMTLTKGAYQLGYDLAVLMTNGVAAKIFISKAGVIENYSQGYLAGISDAGVIATSISRTIFLNIDTTSSYDLMVDGSADSAGTVYAVVNGTGNIADPENSSNFWWLRIR